MFSFRLVRQLFAHRRRRAATLALSRYSDRQLEDIGIVRHDLFLPATHR